MDDAAVRRRHQRLIGAGALLVGALLAWGAASIPSAAGYAGVGPNFLPWVVALALLGCGAALIAQARHADGWRDVDAPSGAARGDWRALAWVVAGVVVNAATITTIGFVLACTLCFMFAVRGLRGAEGREHGGARGLMRDFATGVLIAAPAFWVFTKLLGINLPNITGTTWL